MHLREPDELADATLLKSNTGRTLGAVTSDGEMVATISLEHQGAQMVNVQIANGAHWAVTNQSNARMSTLLSDAGWVCRFEVPRPPDGPEPWPGANAHFPLLLWADHGTTFEVTDDLEASEQHLRAGL